MAINLSKGQKIDLTKSSGEQLQHFCVGVNWGMIEKRGLLGSKKEEVDLDASCALFDASGGFLDVVYFGNLQSKDGSISHSGDDLTGDADGDDGLDNEVISVNLNRIDSQVDQVVFVLNSFTQQDFGSIPFASVRLYDGTPERVDHIHATYNVANDPSFKRRVSMVMGKLYRRNGKWRFAAIGEATKDRKLEETIRTVMSSYL